MIKNKMLKFTKRQKSVILDFFSIAGVTELILLFYKFGLGYPVDWRHFLALPLYFIVVYFILQYVFKLNKILWEFASGKPFLILIAILALDFVVGTAMSFLTFGYASWIATYYYVMVVTCYAVLSGEKLCAVQLYLRKHQLKHLLDVKQSAKNNTLIIGAGWTGSALSKEFTNDPSIFKPVCFVDDSYEKQGRQINDLPVAGTTKDIQKVVYRYHIKKIIFAIPSCDMETRKKIINACIATKCVLKVVPPIHELVDGSDAVPQPRDVRIEDLLGREPMTFDFKEVKKYIHEKVVMVTGGGGSIGSELCRQIAKFEPQKLIILDIKENNAYKIQQELKRGYPSLDLMTEICSIADYDKCDILFDLYRPDIVFHAAAHKHVPLMEHVPEQAIKNNVVGTLNLCKLADKYKVQRFLLISTDKAVNPTNVMGASKRCCEMIVKYHAQRCKDTVFCAVRFGNVLGSNGSVIPLFKKQIAEGGPVTLTDKNIIRYFMTIPEAVSLVLQTGTYSQTGEIFVLDMGQPVKILDLAENLIRLSGFEPYKEIPIVFTGLRPGEKLYEELLISGEGMRKTTNKKIFICKQIDIDEKTFPKQLQHLLELARDNKAAEVKEYLHEIIPTYHQDTAEA